MTRSCRTNRSSRRCGRTWPRTRSAVLHERLHGLEQDLTRLFPELLGRILGTAVADGERPGGRALPLVRGDHLPAHRVSPRPPRPCWCSMTCTGRTSPRSSCSATCRPLGVGRGPARRRVLPRRRAPRRSRGRGSPGGPAPRTVHATGGARGALGGGSSDLASSCRRPRGRSRAHRALCTAKPAATPSSSPSSCAA